MDFQVRLQVRCVNKCLGALWTLVRLVTNRVHPLHVAIYFVFRESSVVTKVTLEIFVSIPMQCHIMALKIRLLDSRELTNGAFERPQIQVNPFDMPLHVSFYIEGLFTKVTLEVFLSLVNVSDVTLEMAHP